MLAFRSSGISGGGDYYSCCQPASTLHATTTKTTPAAAAVENTTRVAPAARPVVVEATEETRSGNSNSNSRSNKEKSGELELTRKPRFIRNFLRLHRDYVILVIALIFVTLNQNSETFGSDICLSQRRSSQQQQLEQFLLKVLKRSAQKSPSQQQKSISFTKIPRKSATTNPSTSRNYYLSRGSTGSSSGALTAGGGPSGSGGNSLYQYSASAASSSSSSAAAAAAAYNNNNNSNNTAAMMMTKQKATMADRLNIGSEVRELKLGCTFNSKNTTTAFHTIKYDFKPASVDVNRVAVVDIGSNNQVTVTVPNLENSGVPNTVYKGNHKKYTKECIIIFDKKTGDMTLEKLNHNIQVKKTRSEVTSKSVGPAPKLENSTMRVSSKTKVSTGSRKNHISNNLPYNHSNSSELKSSRNFVVGYVPRNSPMQQGSSPSTAPVHKSPQSAPAWNANNAQATLPSIPMIIDDDDAGPMFQGAGSGGSSGAGSASSIANLSSSSSASSHNNSADFHVPQQQQQQQKQTKTQSHYNQQPPQQQQQKHHNQRHQQQQQQSQQQQWHQQLQYQQQQQMQLPNPSQQQYHNQNNRMYHNASSNSSNVIGMGVIGGNSSNNCRPGSSISTMAADQTSAQVLASSEAALNQELGNHLSGSSESGTESESSSSDSASESDDSNEDNSQNSHLHQQSLQHQLPNLQATIPPQQQQSQQQSSGYANGGFPNVLHDDLQLSESNSSDSSDGDDD